MCVRCCLRACVVGWVQAPPDSGTRRCFISVLYFFNFFQAPPGQRDKALTPEDVQDLIEYCQSHSESREAGVGVGGAGGTGSGRTGVGMDVEGSIDESESAGSNPAGNVF